jgi:general secretion pathway protein G
MMKIAILVSVTVWVFCGCDRHGTVLSRPRDDMQAISAAVKMYKINNGHLPSTAQGLRALMARPAGDPQPMNWTMLADRVPIDPWGKEYRYELLELNAAYYLSRKRLPLWNRR